MRMRVDQPRHDDFTARIQNFCPGGFQVLGHLDDFAIVADQHVSLFQNALRTHRQDFAIFYKKHFITSPFRYRISPLAIVISTAPL